jgi:hypothetical protein
MKEEETKNNKKGGLKQLIQACIGVAIIVLVALFGHDFYVYQMSQRGFYNHAAQVEVILTNVTENDTFSVIEGNLTNHGSVPVRSATIILTYLDSSEKLIDTDALNIESVGPQETLFFNHEHVDPKGLIKFWKAHLENVKF